MASKGKEKPKDKNWITIKRTVTEEEEYSIIHKIASTSQIAKGLRNGGLNIIQSYTDEGLMWVIDSTGQRIAVLQKEGGLGPDHKYKIEI